MANTYARQRQIEGTSAEWAAHDLVLGDGELALERQADGTVRAKVGNGALAFSAAPYLSGGTTGLRYKGEADPTAAPPAGAAPGDLYSANPAGVVAASWGAPAAGEVLAVGDLLALDVDGAWHVIPGAIDTSEFVTHLELAGTAPGQGGDLIGVPGHGTDSLTDIVEPLVGGAVVVRKVVDVESRAGVQFAAVAPPGEHALYWSQQDDPADEFGFSGGLAKAGGGYIQTLSLFSGLEDGNNTATGKSYAGIHSENGDGTDMLPALFGGNNSVVLGGGNTGGQRWNNLPRANLIEHYVDTQLRGPLTCGFNIGSTVQSGMIANFEGTVTIGATTGTSGSATIAQSLMAMYHTGLAAILTQTYNFAASAFVKWVFAASEFRFGTGHILADTDNAIDIGGPSNRFRTVYAATGTINTSDKREKRLRATGPSEAERAWARSIAFVAYQWLDAIDAKGEELARWHWSATAQDVFDAGIAAGIPDPWRYAFLTRDPVLKTEKFKHSTERQAQTEQRYKHRAIEVIDGTPRIVVREMTRLIPATRPERVRDENGAPATYTRQESLGLDPEGKPLFREVVEPLFFDVPIMETVTETLTREVPKLITGEPKGKNRFAVPAEGGGWQDVRLGLRPDELLAFIIACGRVPAEPESNGANRAPG